MAKRIRNRELELLRKPRGGGRGQREVRELPPFNAPKTGKHTKLKRKGR